MGMNMVTIATETALKILTEETSAHVISLSGNLDVDKKPACNKHDRGKG